MFGKNQVLKQDLEAPDLWVQEIFYTIQGEGPFAGRAAIFIRYAGCNLRCHFCDTDFESSQMRMTVDELTEKVSEYQKGALVVITGGEPFRQDLVRLCRRLLMIGCEIQIETAGTLWQNGMDKLIESGRVTLVCSPKTGAVHSKIEEYCRDWKYIIRKNEVDAMDGLPVMSTQKLDTKLRLYRPKEGQIWLQPMMEYGEDLAEVDHQKTAINTRLCADLCMTYNYRLTIQMHKIVGLP